MEDAKRERSPPSSLAGAVFYMLLGPIVWAAHLAVVYAGHAAPCAKGITRETRALIPIGVELATFLALAALLVGVLTASFRLNRSGDRARASTPFQDKVMITLSLLSAFGVFFAGTSALIIEPCLPLR